MTIEERIAKDAEQFAHENVFYSSEEIVAYQVGARNERNTTIDEMLEKLDKGYKEYVWYKHLREEINSLKI